MVTFDGKKRWRWGRRKDLSERKRKKLLRKKVNNIHTLY